jgi:hypothetical protein
MRHMIALWEAARAGDAETLAEFIRWKGKAAKGEEDLAGRAELARWTRRPPRSWHSNSSTSSSGMC